MSSPGVFITKLYKINTKFARILYKMERGKQYQIYAEPNNT